LKYHFFLLFFILSSCSSYFTPTAYTIKEDVYIEYTNHTLGYFIEFPGDYNLQTGRQKINTSFKKYIRRIPAFDNRHWVFSGFTSVDPYIKVIGSVIKTPMTLANWSNYYFAKHPKIANQIDFNSEYIYTDSQSVQLLKIAYKVKDIWIKEYYIGSKNGIININFYTPLEEQPNKVLSTYQLSEPDLIMKIYLQKP